MKRVGLSAALAIPLAFTLAACETNLDAGGNEGDGDGGAGGGAAVTGAAVTGATQSSGPNTVAATGAGGGSGAGGNADPGFVACPPADGVPEAPLFFPSAEPIYAIAPTEDEILLSGGWLPTLKRIDSRSGALLDERSVGDAVEVLLEDDGTFFGAGDCHDGGNPFVIHGDLSFDPLVPDCPLNPTLNLALAPGGFVYERDAEVLWAPRDGAGAPRVLATFEGWVTDVSSDGTDLFASTMASTEDVTGDTTSVSAIWRLPMDGAPPQKLVEQTLVAGTPGVVTGDIAEIVVDADYVYFDGLWNGRISRVPKLGGEVEVLWDGTQRAHLLAATGTDLVLLDMPERDLGDPACQTILRVLPKSGGDARPIAVVPDIVVWPAFATDGESYFLSQYREGGVGGLLRVPVRP